MESFYKAKLIDYKCIEILISNNENDINNFSFKLKLTDKRKLICERLSFKNSRDILSYYPYRYEEYNLLFP